MVRSTVRPVFAIIVCSLIAFAGGLQNEFVDWDDQPLLVENQAYQGFSAAHLQWMFTTSLGGHFQPLTWFSFAVDRATWGLHPFGFHLTNLLLHILSGVAFYFLARQILRHAVGRGPIELAVELGALAAALFWVVHPLRVESVTWVTERRDVLSGFWLLSATLGYLKWLKCERRASRNKWYALALGCYVLSLLSKAVGMTWPILLLVLDFYPFRRARPLGEATQHEDTSQIPSLEAVGWRRCVVEKIPFFLVAVFFAGAAMVAQRSAGAMWDFSVHPLSLRIAQAFYGIGFYLWKTVWPIALLPLYEQPIDAAPLRLEYVGTSLVIVGITMFCIGKRRKYPALLAGWIAYVVLLSPMLGIAQSGPQLVADRYSYLPSLAIALLLGGAITNLLRTKRHYDRVIRPLLGACWIVFVGLVALTHAQVGVWKNSRSLWERVVQYAPQTGLAYAHLASLDFREGEYELAMNRGLAAVGILPGNRGAHWTVARAAMEMGNLEAAEEHLLAVVSLVPSDASGHALLGSVFAREGQTEKGEAAIRHAVELEPTQSAWRFQLGGFLASERRFDEALVELREAARLQPSDVEAWFRIGVVLAQLQRWDEAAAAWKRGLEIDPNHRETTLKLASLLATCPTP
ncbi:MAG: tetratricopeptide repeat protein [Planctomycetota bacterium]